MSGLRLRVTIGLIACSIPAASNAAGSPGQTDSAYRKSYEQAVAELRAGDTAGARMTVLRLLKQQNRSELHHLLAEAEEASGSYKQAAAEYEIAARMNPSEDNLFDFGSQLLKYHGYSQGLQVFSYAAAKFPRSARLQVGLGVAQYSLGLYQAAVETLCRAVDLNPKDDRALSFLGKMVGVAPELSNEVIRRLKGFSEIYPHNPAANYYYAMSLRQQTAGRTAQANQRAKALLQKALAEDPQFADAHFQLGLLYQDDRLDAKAAHEYELAVKIRPDLRSAHYRLAQIYAKEGKAAMARREYETVRSLNAK